MAGQTFDFELRADDQVSGALKKIGDQVKSLQPELTETEKGLKLGGQETQDELNDVNAAFKTLGRFAKDNVQFIGDMVPPLRNFLGNAGKIGGMAGKFGLAGGAAYVAGKGIAALGGGMADAAHDAYSLQIAAENAGMSVKDFSQLSGAMRLLGSDSESAQGSVEGLYKTFNDALQGRNSAALAIMNQINAPIIRNADGTANVLKTVEQLAKVMPKLSPQNQKTVADALGLDANGLQLLREGARLKELLAKSDEVGLTVDPKINTDLVTLNRNITEVGASWDGLKNRVKQRLAGGLLSDGSVNDGLKGAAHLLQNPTDPVALNEAFGNLRGKEGDWMRRARSDKKYFDALQPDDQLNLLTGQMNDSLRKKLRVRYGLSDQASQLADDAQAITRPPNSTAASPPVSGKVDPAAASVRNNNPWNLNYAGQAGAVPAGRFARFPTPEMGVQAADRQLQLYATGQSANVDYPLRTLNEIIHKASPRSDGNDPEAMIKRAASQLGVSPDESLNLMDTGMRSRVLSALFNQEGNNPFDAAQIEQIISGKSRNGPQDPAPAPLLAAQPPAAPPEPPVNDRTPPAAPPAPLLAAQPPAAPPEPLVNDRTRPAAPPEPSENARATPAAPPVPAASGLTPSASQSEPSLTAPKAPPLVTPAAAPSLVAPVPERSSGSAQDVARAVSEALKETGMKLEVTLINPANGQRQTMTATGGKVTTAMPFPG